MATVKEIFEAIQHLNPRVETISSLGEYIPHSQQMISDSIRREVIAHLPGDSLADKIISSSERFTEKQLWVIAYELTKNEKYSAMISAEIAEREAAINAKREANKVKLASNKAASQNVLDFVKSNGRKLGDYYSFLKSNKKYARDFFSKKFTMESATEFINR